MKAPVTMAIRALRAGNVAFEPHTYAWVAHGATDLQPMIRASCFAETSRSPCISTHNGAA